MADGLEPLRQVHLRQAAASGKCRNTDLGDAVRQGNLLQRNAAVESALTNLTQALIQPYICQGGAAGKHICPHRLERRRKHDGSQGSMVLEGVVCDALNDVAVQLRGKRDRCIRSRVTRDLAIRPVQNSICKF